jgi:hypothetical protein
LDPSSHLINVLRHVQNRRLVRTPEAAELAGEIVFLHRSPSALYLIGCGSRRVNKR